MGKKKKYTLAQKARVMYMIAQNPHMSVREIEKEDIPLIIDYFI